MKSIIFGSTGQDGSYLAEHLLEKGHEVIGIARRTSTPNAERLSNVLDNPNFKLVTGDITDFGSVLKILRDNDPGGEITNSSDPYKIWRSYPYWIFNLAAQSHVGTSFEQACSSMDITAKGCVNILEAARQVAPKATIYQASSSEMFGKAYEYRQLVQGGQVIGSEKYQNEDTKFLPQSPYAIAKVAAHNFCRLYRDAYGMDVRTGILFNHESERRGEEFVTRKITKWLGQFCEWADYHSEACEYNGDHTPYTTKIDGDYIDSDYVKPFPKLRLGNLDVSRDWGHAQDYVKAMTMIMEAGEASDWVVSTGNTHTISEFLELAFELAGLGCWKDYVVIDESLKRPAEVPFLCGESDRIREKLGWKPEISFANLVKRMVENDIYKYRE